ncbi:hypothetical protein LCGC14_1224780 [marine sediment metagenome]|uniref:Uncharacterized protein n=1 Tax=marine sediment metagenome TaxID=412755 RepID=A0A0F9NSK7_9ZZZZ
MARATRADRTLLALLPASAAGSVLVMLNLAIYCAALTLGALYLAAEGHPSQERLAIGGLLWMVSSTYLFLGIDRTIRRRFGALQGKNL